MRRTLIGLAAVGLLAVIGCSDSDSGDDASTSGGDSAEDFCAEFTELDKRFTEDPQAANDPDAVIDALRGLNPPDEIADDFDAVVEIYSQSADVDPDDPDAVAEAQERSESAAEAEERVTAFLEDECDLGADAPEEGDTPADTSQDTVPE